MERKFKVYPMAEGEYPRERNLEGVLDLVLGGMVVAHCVAEKLLGYPGHP